jgi:hypothetical protein
MLTVKVVDQSSRAVVGAKVHVDFYGAGFLGPIIGWMGGNGSSEGTTGNDGICKLSVDPLGSKADVTVTKGISYAEATVGLSYGNGEADVVLTINPGEAAGAGVNSITDWASRNLFPLFLAAVGLCVIIFLLKNKDARETVTGWIKTGADKTSGYAKRAYHASKTAAGMISI